MPRVEAAVRSHLGRIRANNEDNFYLNGVFMLAGQRDEGGLFRTSNNEKHQLYAVCDGMGGMNKGEEASLQAVSYLEELLTAGSRGFAQALQAYADRMSTSFQAFADGGRSAGCTLALVYFDNAHVRVAHLGDSRVYFKRGSSALAQITNDHSQAEWYAQQGILSCEEAAVHPSRHILRRYLGAQVLEGRAVEVSNIVRVRRGDVFLICSDGLSDMVNIREIDEEVSRGKGCAEVCKSLVSLALARGGIDNITVMMIKVV